MGQLKIFAWIVSRAVVMGLMAYIWLMGFAGLIWGKANGNNLVMVSAALVVVISSMIYFRAMRQLRDFGKTWPDGWEDF